MDLRLEQRARLGDIQWLLDALPIKPHPRQLEFLLLECEEKLLGGAAGGGKTEALLMWLAEGIRIPGYTGGIWRRYETDITEGNNSIIAKSSKLYPALGGKLVGMEWRFTSGAKILMAGIAFDKSVLSAQGKEYQRIAFDELTHFTERMYDFIYTTRMRKVVDFPIKCGAASSANPGGPGHDWVKQRFITSEAINFVKQLEKDQPTPANTVFWVANSITGKQPDIAYIPSRAVDNPTLDLDDYMRRMKKNKNPVDLARMMNGDWSIAPEGQVKAEWLRYFSMRGQIIQLLISRKDNTGEMKVSNDILVEFDERECQRFATMDTAGGKEINLEFKGKQTSWTVVAIWDRKWLGDSEILLLRHVWRDKLGITEVMDKLIELHEQWKPSKIRVENETMGPHLYNMLRGKLPIDTVSHEGKDKLARATPMLNMFEQGLIYLPLFNNTWRQVYESELLSWQGIEGETNDQIDVSAYAATECGGSMGNNMVLDVDPRETIQATRSSEFGGGWMGTARGGIKW